MKKLILLLLFTTAVISQPKLGDESDGSRGVPVHVLKLFDEDGGIIRHDDQPLLPFSTKMTCGECHNYETISSGWHFNAGDPDVDPGRRGQPWIYVDKTTATQLPISLRDWPGTFKPAQIGLTNFDYFKRFSRHLPGGGASEHEDAFSREKYVRWMVSGKIEVNCLSCHDAESSHDQAEYATQIRKENYRWAAAASSGFVTVRGSAQDMPDNFDIYFGIDPDNSKAIPPTVTYDNSRFNDRNEVFFDVVRRVPAERCYYCHSSKEITHNRSERWEADEDIHMTAGMICVDCHRNGLDHNMVRGYEGEPQAEGNAFAASLSCQGCHLPSDDSEAPLVGRLGAPVPQHAGLPPVHFEKMTCTACHSGPWPSQDAARLKTSRAHALGTHGVNKSDEALPHIVAPIFARNSAGKLAPHKLFWPSFWGYLNGKDVTPAPLETVRPIIDGVLAATQAAIDSAATADSTAIAKADSTALALADSLAAAGDSTQLIAITAAAEADTLADSTLAASEMPEIPPIWPVYSKSQMVDILKSLGAADTSLGDPVYVSGGQLYQINAIGELSARDHVAAEAYSWEFGHDVRPAAQSLGVRGCNDCHSQDAAIYFGDVPVTPVAASESSSSRSMTEFQGSSALYARLFAFTFIFRPWLKFIMITACVILGAIVLVMVFQWLSGVLKSLSGEK